MTHSPHVLDRDKEIARLFMEGMKDKRIGATLFVCRSLVAQRIGWMKKAYKVGSRRAAMKNETV